MKTLKLFTVVLIMIKYQIKIISVFARFLSKKSYYFVKCNAMCECLFSLLATAKAEPELGERKV
jgi:hypothetical protein